MIQLDPKGDPKGDPKQIYGAKKENHCGKGKYYLYSTYAMMPEGEKLGGGQW